MSTDTGRIKLLEMIGNAIVGGMERYVTNLVARLPGDRFDITCLCPYESPITRDLRGLGCKVYVAPMAEQPDWASIQFATSLVRSQGIHVIHAHLANAHLLASLCGAVTGVRTLAMLHGRCVGELDHEVYRLGHSDLGVVCQNAFMHALNLGVDPQHVHWIPNGIDAQAQVSTARGGALQESLGISASALLIGFVGRLAPEKRPDVFVRAVRHLRVACPHVQAVIVGDGPLRSSMQTLVAELELGRCVHFLGVRSDVPGIFASLSALAVTSDSEGMPLALMEAMAAGVPVVATNVGGVAEIVCNGETGVLVPPDEPEAVARELALLLAHPERRVQMGARARARVLEHFCLGATVERTAQILVELSARSRGMTSSSSRPAAHRFPHVA